MLRWLNTAQRKLCWEGGILVSAWTTSTVAGQEEYSTPIDWTRVRAVFLYSTSGSQVKLTPIRMEQRDPRKSTGTPAFYYIWGLNVSGSNAPTIGLNPIPSTSGTSDLELRGHQIPADMVNGGQAPEVMYQWQDGLVCYATWQANRRKAAGGEPKWLSMAQDSQMEWEDWLRQARSFHNPLGLDSPTTIQDTEGYTVSRD